ncbi:hypothetical protein RchiOBHm_Chr6g0306961 [Rosa chinensis]|uniref:Uncharacterized protein n=1 Tax=Rosa chinensis TaxID=74649 RepID=A0A2P6Q082_ROSCH|nr:hypothetical protein RchiOBHm_Chr6g0306961 [Rosa chinensis]
MQLDAGECVAHNNITYVSPSSRKLWPCGDVHFATFVSTRGFFAFYLSARDIDRLVHSSPIYRKHTYQAS